jgi:hypothetical protein
MATPYVYQPTNQAPLVIDSNALAALVLLRDIREPLAATPPQPIATDTRTPQPETPSPATPLDAVATQLRLLQGIADQLAQDAESLHYASLLLRDALVSMQQGLAALEVSHERAR